MAWKNHNTYAAYRGDDYIGEVDGHNFPNLVLMKLSAWHKHQGDSVHLLRPDDVLLGGDLFGGYDKLYAACVFSESREIARKLIAIGAEVGGTGSGEGRILPPEVENIRPDYSLYGIQDVAYGFLTRGCPRACPFCIVADKEGQISRKVADLRSFWDGERHIKLLDPNLLAASEHMELLGQLAASRAWVDFTQGLDARLLTEENVAAINEIKVKMIHFAWDNPRDESIPRRLQFFAERTDGGFLQWRRTRIEQRRSLCPGGRIQRESRTIKRRCCLHERMHADAYRRSSDVRCDL